MGKERKGKCHVEGSLGVRAGVALEPIQMMNKHLGALGSSSSTQLVASSIPKALSGRVSWGGGGGGNMCIKKDHHAPARGNECRNPTNHHESLSTRLFHTALGWPRIDKYKSLLPSNLFISLLL